MMEYEHSNRVAFQVEVCGGEFNATQYEMRRPFYLCRAEMIKHGPEHFEAKYGGVSGHGKTPQVASISFDLVWLNGEAKP